MRIYRGHVGIELTLNEFCDLLETEDGIDDLLNTIYGLEMDEAMNYSDADIQEFESTLFREMEEYKKEQEQNDDIAKMRRILDRLKKYE